MKTAISLPDNIYFEAEETAHDLGVSRSTLYLNALKDYLEKNGRRNITQRLNEVYGNDCHNEFEPMSNAALESMIESTKHDSW